jgi:hypothetical protein
MHISLGRSTPGRLQIRRLHTKGPPDFIERPVLETHFLLFLLFVAVLHCVFDITRDLVR